MRVGPVGTKKRVGLGGPKLDQNSTRIFSVYVDIESLILVAIGLSGILKEKQKLGVTFNSDKLGGIDFTKFSKLTMCSA